MASDVVMPKLTDSMEEGRIVEWLVAVGDVVRAGDVLAEIETDKAVMELESFWDGTVLELLQPNGEVVAVGEVVARVGAAAEAAAPEGGEAGAGRAGETMPEPAPAAPPPVAEPEPEPEPETVDGAPPAAEASPAASTPVPGGHPVAERGGVRSARPAAPKPPPAKSARAGGGVRASPRARRRALELGVALAAVSASGAQGQITVEDVERAAQEGDDATQTAVPARGGLPADRADEELPAVVFDADEAEVEEVSFYQQAVIRRVVASKHVIPHFYVTKSVRADALLRRWEEEKAISGATLTHFIMRACAMALAEFPQTNRSYDRGRWIRWQVVHLGLAVQTDAGLVVAVLRDAGGEPLRGIASRTRDLVERARAGRLSLVERSNPTFTLSNLGGYDVESFAAIINPPSALTLAVGSVLETPVVHQGKLAVGNVLHLTLSCDHRVVDGVLAAEFLGEVKRLLERPAEL